jgi:hypothetical protein
VPFVDSGSKIKKVTEMDEFYVMEPPYFQLEEAIDWLELQISDAERDGWTSIQRSINRLEDALRHGKLQGCASLDALPVLPIAACTWTEFGIHPARSDGRIIWAKAEGSHDGYVVRSNKVYRAAALNDLSQPAKYRVPGPGGLEPGYHRVIDQVIFHEENLRNAFLPENVSSRKERNGESTYQKILKEIEGGRFLHHPDPRTFDEVFELVMTYLKEKRLLATTLPASIRKGLKRHYGLER